MMKKILATALTVLLLVASTAFAANMQVNSQAVPVSGGTVSPSGIKFYSGPATYTVTPKAGWTVTSVLIDGVAATAPYTVPFNTNMIHTVRASFAQTLYTITTTATSGGSVAITGGSQYNILPASTRSYTVAPGTGNQIASLTVDGAAVPAAVGSQVPVTGSFTNIQGNHTIDAVFSVVAIATVVNAGADQNIAALTTNVVGSVSKAVPAAWTSSPAGGTFGNANATSTTFSAPAGTYTVTLTADGVSDSATITLGASATTCTTCHAGNQAVVLGLNCTVCHSDTQHSVFVKNSTPAQGNRCIDCHAFNQNAGAGYVQDNNGVRAITTEFTKWSHHVTGVALQDAHCAACHLEGKVQGASILVDHQYHMSDAKVHLRNADTDADMQWDPAAPNHTNMDNFCMSCHDANGATSSQSAAIRTVMIPAAGKTASATNPFGDTISNRYDKMQRPAVVDASSQFNTTNNSHHAVKGPRYTGRTRAADARQIDSPATFANNSSALLKGKRSTMFDAGVLNQLYVPLENEGGEVAPRTGAATLGDDSTLHCGDCHTVGQWKAGSSVNRLGQPTPDAIGAHGSNNEYLLRNSIGTDQRHTQNAYTIAANVVTITNPNGAFLVCYNCHAYSKYGSVFNATGVAGPHAGEYDQAGRCDGIGNTLPFNGYTTGTATDGTQFASRFEGPITKYSSAAAYAGEQNPDFGNIFGIQCQNCHNSGLGNAYGGIHGSANNTHTTTQTTDPSVTGGAYIDGMGNTTKVERFLPGLGNAMHVPGTLGGFTGGSLVNVVPSYITGGISNDTNWEQKHWQQTATTSFGATGTGPVVGTLTSAGAGCYTLSESATAATATVEGPSVTGAGGPATEGIGIWGGCDDHGAAQGKGDHGFIKRIVRPITY